MSKPRITPKHVERAKRTAATCFGLDISDEQARRVLEIDPTLLPELNADGSLDTAPRDYFGMALIELIMPGPPAVQDDLIGEEQDCWHWPCFGSGDEYTRAFETAFRKAIREHGITATPA